MSLFYSYSKVTLLGNDFVRIKRSHLKKFPFFYEKSFKQSQGNDNSACQQLTFQEKVVLVLVRRSSLKVKPEI